MSVLDRSPVLSIGLWLLLSFCIGVESLPNSGELPRATAPVDIFTSASAVKLRLASVLEQTYRTSLYAPGTDFGNPAYPYFNVSDVA